MERRRDEIVHVREERRQFRWERRRAEADQVRENPSGLVNPLWFPQPRYFSIAAFHTRINHHVVRARGLFTSCYAA